MGKERRKHNLSLPLPYPVKNAGAPLYKLPNRQSFGDGPGIEEEGTSLQVGQIKPTGRDDIQPTQNLIFSLVWEKS